MTNSEFLAYELKHRKPSQPVGLSSKEPRPESERELQNQIANWLRQKNVWFAQSRMDRKTSNGKGQPDFLFAWKRCTVILPVAIECKTETGQLTSEQQLVREEMMMNGWQYYVVRSLPELIQLL